MIAPEMIAKIRTETQWLWEQEVQKSYFQEIAQGKEVGHRIADLVDEKTSAFITTVADYVTGYQRDRGGTNERARSMGDVWLHSNGIFHPVNVKTGITKIGSNNDGQPNMVSLKKLLAALLGQQIDSYYLLMVKFDLQLPITVKVYFLDMLDYLEYVTFDSGPGQIMLKSRQFFLAMDQGVIPPQRTIVDKVEKLVALLEDGERRLLLNRQRALEQFRQKVLEYRKLTIHEVTADSQKSLHLYERD